MLFRCHLSIVIAFITVKYNVKDKKQLEFDLRTADYFVAHNLSFEHLSTPKAHEYYEWLAPQFHVKHPTTFTRYLIVLLISEFTN